MQQEFPERELILSYREDVLQAVAVREDGLLVEYEEVTAERDGAVGCVFAGKVTEYVRALSGCFVEIGSERRGYLSASDYRAGEWILCQGSGEAHENKGIRLSDRIKLPGRYLVLLDLPQIGVSAKIEDGAVRGKLQQLGESLLQTKEARGLGLIFRTEAQFATDTEIQSDFAMLLAAYREIGRRFETAHAHARPQKLFTPDPLPGILYRYPPHTVKKITGDSATALHALGERYPDYREKTQLSRINVLEATGVSRELAQLSGRKVWLKSGAYLIFDRTEAMTVVDVNSGKISGKKNPRELALAVNFEAADELMRQLRLRKAGGMILCDFIDMEYEEDREALLDRMRVLAQKDPGRTEVHDITLLGIAEITRKRTKSQG